MTDEIFFDEKANVSAQDAAHTDDYIIRLANRHLIRG